MRLPDSAQTEQPWRIHDLTRDFELVDVWALPTPGGPEEFPALVDLLTRFDPATSSSRLVRALFAIRFRVGRLLGWDDPDGEASGALFTPLYSTHDEWAGEIENRTVHGILHLGWVEDGPGAYRGQLAVYVKRNGLLGSAYMAAIGPFRHLIVYPQMLRDIGRRWQRR